MKIYRFALALLLFTLVSGGCTQIVKMEPTSGPPGTPVRVTCNGMWGDPSDQVLKWDNDSIRKPFPGFFTVPPVEKGGTPGKHSITVIDNLDANEAFLIFPIFRWRMSTVHFTVTPL